MTTVLITGANRGIGLELARAYAADGARVLATARDVDAAGELASLPGVRLFPLDVRERAAIRRLAETLRDEPLHVLIANAGIFGPPSSAPGQRLGSLDYDAWADVLEVNLLGAVATAEAFLPNVRAARGRIVAITSHLGSIADTSGGLYAYRSSKAALNMAFQNLAHDLAREGIAVAVLHPGWVSTRMGGDSAPVSPEDSAHGLKRVIAGLRATGGRAAFLDYEGRAQAW